MKPEIQGDHLAMPSALKQIDQIVEWAGRVGSPMGYFTRWFGHLLTQLDAECNWDRFSQPDLIRPLLVQLANRYFDALQLYLAGEGDAPFCWQAAFVATHQAELTVFQHLVMGTNAVVHYDLPISLASLLSDEAEEEHLADLAILLDQIEGNLRQTQDLFAQQSRIFRMMDAFGRSHDHWFDVMHLDTQTMPTYSLAKQLQQSRGAAYQRMRQQLDQTATQGSREILISAHRVLRRWFTQVSRWENQPASAIIAWMDQRLS